MFSISVPTKQLDAVKGMLALVPKQMDYGLKLMLNVLAEDVGKAQTKLIGSSIDRPAPYTLRAVFVKSATEQDLRALVGIKQPSGAKTERDYWHTLIYGGARPRKGVEGYLIRGVEYYGMASDDYPLNQYGNLPNGMYTKIISQLKLFRGNGYNTGYDMNRTGVSTIFPVWQRAAHGGLLPGIYERFAMSKAGKIKTGKSSFKRRKNKPSLYPRGVRPLMMLSTRPYTYKKQIPWHETAQATVNANADKAAAIAIRYALGKG